MIFPGVVQTSWPPPPTTSRSMHVSFISTSLKNAPKNENSIKCFCFHMLNILIDSYLIFLNFSKTILLCSSVFFMDWVLSQNGLSDVPQEISLKSPNQLKWSTPCKTIGSDYMEQEVLGSLRREWVLTVDWFHYVSNIDIISWSLMWTCSTIIWPGQYLFQH